MDSKQELKSGSIFLSICATINVFSFIPGLIMAFLHLAFSIVFLSLDGLGADQQNNFLITSPLFFFIGYLIAAIISTTASVLIIKYTKLTHSIAGFLLIFPTCLLGMLAVIDILHIILWYNAEFGDGLPYVADMYVAAIVTLCLVFIQFWYHIFLTQLLRMKGAGWY